MSINATPFNPTFKLIGNLQEDQVLVYDTSQGAFVNANGTGAGSDGSGIDSVSHIGVGNQLGSVTGSSIVLQTITAGTNVTITDSGNGLVISADLSETLQSGTNIGNGSAILSGIDNLMSLKETRLEQSDLIPKSISSLSSFDKSSFKI